MSIAGSPAYVAIDGSAARVAVADFDRAVRIWDFANKELVAQLDLAMQPSSIKLSVDGAALGAIYPDSGLSLWNIERPQRPLLELAGRGNWNLSFSPSGARVVAGQPATGYNVYDSNSGALLTPAIGVHDSDGSTDLLAFSGDEQMVLTGSLPSTPRMWRVASTLVEEGSPGSDHAVWSRSGDRVMAITPDARHIALGDPSGHVHILPAGATLEDLATASDGVSFLGHVGEVRYLTADRSSQLIASVDERNTLRVWRVVGGEPLPWVTELPGVR